MFAEQWIEPTNTNSSGPVNNNVPGQHRSSLRIPHPITVRHLPRAIGEDRDPVSNLGGDIRLASMGLSSLMARTSVPSALICSSWFLSCPS